MFVSKGKILIVDDEGVVRSSLTEWFAGEGYTTKGVPNGRDALEAVDRQDWDVALIDLKMPGMDGVELQRHLRDKDPELTVIMMTGFGTVETAVQALKQGAYDYLTKPITLDRLELLVQRAHRRQSLLRENRELRQQIRRQPFAAIRPE